MDRYKKKNMKFMGKGSEIRAVEMNAARGSVRQQRFSLQRPLEDIDQQSTDKVHSQASKLPTLGIPKLQSRLDMLNKWKAEKELKKRLEMNSKPPVFKVGSARPNLGAAGLSRLKESKTESFSSKVLTPNRSISKTLKASRIQPVSKLADITHHKNISSRPEAKASGKTIQARTIPTTEIKPPTLLPQRRTQISTKIQNSTKPVAGKSAITKEEKKIPTTGIKPPTLLPQRRTQLQNQKNKLNPVSTVQSKKAVAKAVETPINPEPEEPTSCTSDKTSSLLSCPLSAIEVSAKESSFAPFDFVFRPPKIRSSWLDDEGPYTILSRVMKEMKPRTSTPIKKEMIEHQEIESSFDKGNSMDPGESSSEAKKEQNSIDDRAEDSKTVAVVVSSVENQGLETEISKKMTNLVLHEKENLVNSPVTEPASSDKQELVTSPEKEAVICVASEENLVELCDERKDYGDVKELTDVSSPIVGSCFGTINKDLTQNVTIEEDISVFYPSEPAAVAPQKSKRFFSNCWKMEKPSLALISESPENSKEFIKTPKSHRRKGLLEEEFRPRRSPRLSRKKELKEENIFDVKECFLDSPSVEAATRMSMRPYDFDRLHLEASASQGKSTDTQSTRANRGKVSLLYTPPCHRASTRNKSLKGDLMTFSPNIE